MSIKDLPPDKLLARALRLIELGRLDTAAKVLKLAALKAPGDVQIQGALAQVQDALAQTSSDAADEAAQLDALFGEAQADAAAGDLDAAARKLQVLRAARPKDGDVRSLFDEVQARRTGQKRRDVGLNVTTRTALQARLEERDWDGAEAVLRERLQEQRDSADVHLQLALVLLHGKDTPRAALPHAREAVALSPDRADARVVLADLLGKTGQRQASQEARAVATQLAEDQELNLSALRIELASPFQEAGRVGEGLPSTVAAAPPNQRGRALRLGALVVLLIALAGTAGGVWYSLQPKPVDVEPYRIDLPVLAAEQMPKSTELTLVVAATEWGALPASTRTMGLNRLRPIAQANGYDAVFIRDEAGAFLGSVRGDLTWLADGGATSAAPAAATPKTPTPAPAAPPKAEDAAPAQPPSDAQGAPTRP